MKLRNGLLLFIFSFVLLLTACCGDHRERKNVKLIEQMFSEVSEKMALEHVDDYFDPDFVLSSNRQTLNYSEFKDHLSAAFKLLKSIELQKPFEDAISKDNKVAIRAKIITTNMKNEKFETDFMAIFEIKDHKIYRWWELTYPDWTVRQ